MIDDVLTIDDTTFQALQIFQTTSPLAGSKCGSWNKKSEGLSIYKLLNRCKSVLGSKFLHYMCRCPPKDLEIILERQETVGYLAHPNQSEFCSFLRKSLKHVKNVPAILRKLFGAQSTAKDWKNLKMTAQSLIKICEACQKCASNIRYLLAFIRVLYM